MEDETFTFDNVKTKPIKQTRAMSLVGSSPGRNESDFDFYPTPDNATQALLDKIKFQGTIWEPACGDGAMCRVLEKNNYSVHATDLIDRGYGASGLDFLQSQEMYDNIVTNPPYCLAEDFIHKALASSRYKVAMLVKLQFLEGQKRKKMFETTPLETVLVFSKRISMYRNGQKGNYSSSMIAFCWMVWNQQHKGPATLQWI